MFRHSIQIQTADRGDLDAIFRIYDHFVTTSHVTFDTQPYDQSQRESWFAQFDPTGRHRLLIARCGDAIAGYASSKPFRPKPAYQTSVETTVYIAPDCGQRGVGTVLMTTLLDQVAAGGAHRAYAGVALPNPGSVRLHEQLGFRLIGTFHEVGYKLGRYWDVSWYEKPLCSPRSDSQEARPL